jgi:glycosyltransferase involved in cell wall biosynthesis
VTKSNSRNEISRVVIPGVSVIVCCYNSSSRLKKTLEHLAFQSVPQHIPWEIILIDNASTDETLKIAESEWFIFNRPHISFKILKEKRRGKNYAFELGVQEARYEFILTCDDDNWLSTSYVATSFEIMSTNLLVGALGGIGIFEPENPVTDNISGFKQYYVNGEQSWAEKDHWVYGAGSVYRRSVYLTLLEKGWQQITPGRQGKKLICGEDVEICFMFYLSGYKIISDNRLEFKHFVPKKRQNQKYLTNICYWYGYSYALLGSYTAQIDGENISIQKKIDDWLKGTAKLLIKQMLKLTLKSIATFSAPSLDHRIKFMSNLGTFVSLKQNKTKIINQYSHIKGLLT